MISVVATIIDCNILLCGNSQYYCSNIKKLWHSVMATLLLATTSKESHIVAIGRYCNKYDPIVITSNWACVTYTCEILKLQNMDKNGCYVHLYLYDELSSFRPSDIFDPSVRHVRGTRFGCIRRDPEYAFTPLFIFLSPQSAMTQMTPRRFPSTSCQLARSMRGTLPIIG
jgi:hypothetical protein